MTAQSMTSSCGSADWNQHGAAWLTEGVEGEGEEEGGEGGGVGGGSWPEQKCSAGGGGPIFIEAEAEADSEGEWGDACEDGQ
jgi:hypothetical protein